MVLFVCRLDCEYVASFFARIFQERAQVVAAITNAMVVVGANDDACVERFRERADSVPVPFVQIATRWVRSRNACRVSKFLLRCCTSSSLEVRVRNAFIVVFDERC